MAPRVEDISVGDEGLCIGDTKHTGLGCVYLHPPTFRSAEDPPKRILGNYGMLGPPSPIG